ncbi:hypothetical protein VT84_19325 [Gemmata sp. SH-PL17]|uniref:hypothetical protein n=1 Tax=Gemmata sp. SH-PL17 TaxID=1630693 RepID=UPI00078C1028|nr:hypothetical protein [Gemmata sp. SH-PL17]AMV26560.1 hypothetical protein VT84_19325 [Gemmata sp. SH-PL17]
MTEFLTRVGDRINPIVVKETRQAVNSRLVAWFLLLFLTVQLVVMLLMITTREVADSDNINLRIGRDMFMFVQGILLGACMILIPTMTGARLAAERSDINVDLLFISSLTPRAVLAGKLFAAGALALLIFSACAPFMTFAYVMRGLDVPTIFVVLTADYLTVLLGTTFALFLASVPANRGLRILLGLGGFIPMCYLGAGLLVLTTEFLQGRSFFDMSSREFWAGCAGLVLLLFGTIGLLFVWAVALISPPAANRAFIVRVYTLGLWLVEGLGFAIWSLYISRPEPMAIWGVMGCAFFSLQIVIASCERDEWGARVARRIPRRAVLRAPAFFLYSGAAGGLAFGVIGAGLTALVLAGWYLVVPPPYAGMGAPERETAPLLTAVLIAAYAYCYSLTAIVLRRAVSGSGFRSGYTWIITALLFGIGCTLPYIARFAFFERTYYYTDDYIALYLTNPVVMIGDAVSSSSSGGHVALTGFFLVAWAGVVTLANVTWLAKQVMNFRPPEAEYEADE